MTPRLVVLQGGKPADAPPDPKHRAKFAALVNMWRVLTGAVS